MIFTIKIVTQTDFNAAAIYAFTWIAGVQAFLAAAFVTNNIVTTCMRRFTKRLIWKEATLPMNKNHKHYCHKHPSKQGVLSQTLLSVYSNVDWQKLLILYNSSWYLQIIVDIKELAWPLPFGFDMRKPLKSRRLRRRFVSITIVADTNELQQSWSRKGR